MKKRQRLINLVYTNSKYFGKHIIILGGKIYAVKAGFQASELLEKLLKKYPSETPTITYVPKADAVLFSSFVTTFSE